METSDQRKRGMKLLAQCPPHCYGWATSFMLHCNKLYLYASAATMITMKTTQKRHVLLWIKPTLVLQKSISYDQKF